MKSALIAKILAAASALALTAASAGVTPDLLDSSGKPVRDSQKECVQNLSSVNHPDCMDKVVEAPKPVIAPVAVAPEPVKPVAPVAPVVPEAAAAAAPSSVKAAVTIQAEALFDFDKSVVKPAGKKSIDEAIAKMKDLDLEVVIATGHTDSVGTDAYNQKLSERRANSVKEYMSSKGIAGAKITTLGKGETQPIASNTSAEGRAKNRRVDIEFKGVNNK